ncbi:ADP-ribose pyrophosphatase [Bifidobacterium dolichotidis]|uniref:ADP-ribose pyrophosphatase n=1 Tax=Bifidobacterium dolichotidis TaxID=2306976 RepID=A0A430FRP3_9BIFI|nr:DUF4916 domain-containing protein [Bifidobacterium dolichotidis]RSX55538.1 ADP-ribose pyrophosphatase [Bifidobacterium dolichotidis]
MRVLDGEIPSEGDFDAENGRGGDGGDGGDFGSGHFPGDSFHEPDGWMEDYELAFVRSRTPMPYVVVVPVHTDQLGRVEEVGTLLRVSNEGSIVERALVAGRVMHNEELRHCIMRHVTRDLGPLALPALPISMQPFMVAEFFPSQERGSFYDSRQHAIALCYIVTITGDCQARDETIDVEWTSVKSDNIQSIINQMPDGHGRIVAKALEYAGVL